MLVDLEEKHRQANATIKEKEYLISNLLKSGKLLHIHSLGKRDFSVIYYHLMPAKIFPLLFDDVHWLTYLDLVPYIVHGTFNTNFPYWS